MNEEEERPSFVLPALLSAAQTAFTIAAIVAAIAIAYLLFGIFSHQLDGYDQLPTHAERLRIKTNLGYAGTGPSGRDDHRVDLRGDLLLRRREHRLDLAHRGGRPRLRGSVRLHQLR